MLIELGSSRGKRLLLDCLNGDQGQETYWALVEHWEAQIRGTFCGVASAVCVLNAVGACGPRMDGFPAQYRYFTQTNLFSADGVSAVVPESEVHRGGMSLDMLAGIIKAATGQYATIQTVHCENDADLSGFRALLRDAMTTAEALVVANYDREVLGQHGSGHISPLAAYHQATDHVLILDVAKHKCPPTWVSLPLLFRAMQSRNVHGVARGFVIVRRRRNFYT